MAVDGICAVVLAAGEGRRLRPLTVRRPKALCPVGNVELLDRALRNVAALGFTGPSQVAVNAWHLADQVVVHTLDRAHVSVESTPAPLGSAGGLGALRDWIAGRHVLVANADAYLARGELSGLLDGWDGDEVRLLGVAAGTGPGARPAEFGAYRFAGMSLLPAATVAALPATQSDLVRAVWRPAEAAGRLSVVDYGGVYLDSGTPADYLAANLHAAWVEGGGTLIAPGARVTPTATVRDSVIGPRTMVNGYVERSVVWPYATVQPHDHLIGAIRYGPKETVYTEPRATTGPQS